MFLHYKKDRLSLKSSNRFFSFRKSILFIFIYSINFFASVNGKIICRKLTKKNVGFPTYFFVSSIYDIIYLCQQRGGEDTNDM